MKKRRISLVTRLNVLWIRLLITRSIYWITHGIHHFDIFLRSQTIKSSSIQLILKVTHISTKSQKRVTERNLTLNFTHKVYCSICIHAFISVWQYDRSLVQWNIRDFLRGNRMNNNNSIYPDLDKSRERTLNEMHTFLWPFRCESNQTKPKWKIFVTCEYAHIPIHIEVGYGKRAYTERIRLRKDATHRKEWKSEREWTREKDNVKV